MLPTTCIEVTLVLFQILVQISTSSSESCYTDEAAEPQCHSLYFLSLLPYPDDNPSLQPSWDEGPTLFLAEQLAVEEINKRTDILPDYHIDLVRGDSGCNIRNKAVIAFVEHVIASGKQIVGIVGPGCSTSATTVSPLSGNREIALLTVHGAGSLILTDRDKHPYAFGTLDSTEVFVETLITLMKKNDWTQVATLYDETRVYYYSTLLEFERRVQNITDLTVAFSAAVYDTYIPFSALKQTNIRVIFLLVGPDFLVKIFCLAYHMDFLLPKYQWVVVSRTTEEIIQQTDFVYNGKRYTCDKDDMRKAASGNLLIHYKLTPFNTTSVTDTGLSYEEFASKYVERIEMYNIQTNATLVSSFWAPAFYDAVWSLAYALNSSIETLKDLNLSLSDYKFGQHVITNVVRLQIEDKVEFEGVSGRIHFESQNGYVGRVVDIYQVTNNSTTLISYYSEGNIVVLNQLDFITDTFATEVVAIIAPLPAAVVLLTFTLITFLLLVATQIMSIIRRDARSVKAASPKLNHVAYGGCYILLLGTVSFITLKSFIIPAHTQCILWHVLNASVFTGGTLVFGIVLGKTWRIYRILVHYLNPGRLISDKILITFTLLLAAFDICVNIVWIAVDPFVPTVVEESRTENTIEAREHCIVESNYYFLWFVILAVQDIILMLASLWFAILCHRVPSPMKDFKTTSVIILVYSVSLVLVIGLPTFFLLPPTSVLPVLISFSLTLLVIVYLFIAFLFLPPVIPLLKHKYIKLCH